jgi:hypothetical protein
MPEPKLRHEFVGMMFAVTIGEVGLQAATLVHADHVVHFLPAYSHLVLATVMIAASWVGWTLSPSPGATQDVSGVFQSEFLVLLVDVALVIVYFILVKAVDITGERTIRLNASAAPEAFWVCVMFGVYLFWDVLTKVAVYGIARLWEKPNEWWWSYGIRIVPTVVCLALAIVARQIVATADAPHVLTADMALLGLVLLFRALKGLVSAFWPTPRKPTEKEPTQKEQRQKKELAIFWSMACIFAFAISIQWTRSWSLPESVASQIRTALPEEKEPAERPSLNGQPHPSTGDTVSAPETQ